MSAFLYFALLANLPRLKIIDFYCYSAQKHLELSWGIYKKKEDAIEKLVVLWRFLLYSYAPKNCPIEEFILYRFKICNGKWVGYSKRFIKCHLEQTLYPPGQSTIFVPFYDFSNLRSFFWQNKKILHSPSFYSLGGIILKSHTISTYISTYVCMYYKLKHWMMAISERFHFLV